MGIERHDGVVLGKVHKRDAPGADKMPQHKPATIKSIFPEQ